ncbi:aspartyl/asparaginyl beta-hydroxylase isoform X10 [Rhinoraja longicauda]
MASKSKGNNSSRSSSAGSRKDKHGSNKNGKKGDGPSGTSFLPWFMIIALLGVWSSVAVIWFDLVDYEEVLGKLGIHDADGDGDFDLEDAKILLGLTKGDGSEEQIDTIEEVLDIITEESSNWVYGFLSFLYDVMTPFEILEEENEASEDVAGTSENEGYEGKENCVTLDLQNQ